MPQEKSPTCHTTKRTRINLPTSANQTLTTQIHPGPSLSGEAQESVGSQIIGVIIKKKGEGGKERNVNGRRSATPSRKCHQRLGEYYTSACLLE